MHSSLRDRLRALIKETVDDTAWLGESAARESTAEMRFLGSIRPLRRLGGAAAQDLAASTRDKLPPPSDIWVHRRAAARAARDSVDQARRELDERDFSSNLLTSPARWHDAELDPPLPGEQPGVPETEARDVAEAAIRREGATSLVGDHLLYCRFTFGATRRQPVWLARFEVVGEPHLLIINADTDTVLDPVDRSGRPL